jgi:hypothetical protein
MEVNMEETAYDIRQADTLAAWQQALAEVPQTPALSGALLRRRDDLFGRFAAWYGRLRRRPRAERRRWQRQLGLSLAGIALLLAVNGAPVGAVGPAATITVNGGACDLIEAIGNANDTTTGQPNTDCAAGNPAGADTIVLQVNVTLTASNNATYGPTGLPVITSAITIEGNGNTISRSSATDFRILAVASGGNLTLNSATVSGGAASGITPPNTGAGGGIHNRGTLTVSNSTLSGNSASFSGGGIYNGAGATVTVQNSILSGNAAFFLGGGILNSGTLTVQNSILSGNAAPAGGGIYNLGTVTVSNSTLSGNSVTNRGGGILNSGTLTVQSNSTLSENSADQHGGGIFNSYYGALTVSNSTLSANSADTYGGGIYNSATLTISNSTFSINSADYGGGIWNAFTLTISNSTLSGNSATNRGGGIYNGAGGTVTVQNSTLSGNSATNGGGIDNIATLTVQNSTLSGNSAVTSGSNGGGGINNRNTLTVQNSTLSGNSATNGGGIYNLGSVTVTVQNSTLSGNSATNGGGIRNNGRLTVSNSTLSGNSAAFGGGIRNDGPLTVQNSTLSGNSAGSGGGINNGGALTISSSIVAAQTGTSTDCSGSPVATDGYNIESANTCGFTGTGDQQNVSSASLALGGLANNGGPTQTRALGFGSVALDHIPKDVLEANGCGVTVTTDQRGLPRAGGTSTTGGSACDVGAYEAQTPPLAVTLASFAAQAMVDRIQLTWETVSEANNAGFNLYRSASPAAPDALLAYVPSQAPGSTQGASYSFDDTQVTAGQTWYYWLEDVDLSGATSLHGPVSATLQAPTAVTLDALEAQAATPGNVTAWGALVAALIAAAGAIGVQRRSRVH